MTASPTNTTLYTDCFSGISGDMFIGALLNAGLPFDTLREGLKLLDLEGYELSASPAKSTIAATLFSVRDHRDKNHPHRNLQSIVKIIESSRLAPHIVQQAVQIFTTLARAEATVHGTTVEAIHFHEVGAVDSIIDVVGAAIGLDYFGISAVYCSPLPMPSGWVQCEHGRLPLPAPAVAELTKDIPVYGVEQTMELVTPTGAALVKTLAKSFGPMPPMTPTHVGYGSGSRVLPNGQPNLLRVIIGRTHQAKEAQEIMVTETNLDDCPPERIPYLLEKLFSKRALDASLTPIQMKKGRPGFTLQVISSAADAWELQRTILQESSAIGLRYRLEQRWTLAREIGTVSSPWGQVQAKLIHGPDADRLTPEFEDCRRVAMELGIPLDQVYATISSQPPTAFRPRAKKE